MNEVKKILKNKRNSFQVIELLSGFSWYFLNYFVLVLRLLIMINRCIESNLHLPKYSQYIFKKIDKSTKTDCGRKINFITK